MAPPGRTRRFLAAAISKRILDAPLENPGRLGVHQAIEANPGATLSELRRITGLGSGNLRHHLRVLETARTIQHWRHGRTTHYALVEASTTATMQHRALDDPQIK